MSAWVDLMWAEMALWPEHIRADLEAQAPELRPPCATNERTAFYAEKLERHGAEMRRRKDRLYREWQRKNGSQAAAVPSGASRVDVELENKLRMTLGKAHGVLRDLKRRP